MNDCIFCKIVNGELPSYTVYEDENFLAFLDIFPSHEYQTLVVPKKHISSKFSETDTETLRDLVEVGQDVAKNIEESFDDVARCQILFEGFEVPHLHMKIFPATKPNIEDDFLSKSGDKADENELERISKILNN